MTDKGLPSLELSMIPTNETTITHDEKMLVMDNLNLTPPNDADNTADFMKRFPLKLSSASIVVIVSGKVKFSVNFRDFEATENSCVIISTGTIIEQVEIQSDTRLMFLSFAAHLIPTSTYVHGKNVNKLYALQVALIKLQPSHIALLKSSYLMLRTILTDDAFALERSECAYNCLNLMGSIIAQGAANDQPQVTTKASRKDEIVARFLQCVHENYREHRELGFYADQLCLSLKYMSHIVFEQTGRHPSRWIKDYVILDAKTMLRSGRYTVQQVATELNFPNQSFFGKYFKEAVGVSPKKWQ